MELLCELKGAHYDAINSIDVSPGMSMLVSSGSDSTASVFDLKQKRVIKKLTFRDNECKDVRGNADLSNFGIRGCFFTSNGQYVYILASKAAYRSYLVKYHISSRMMGQFPVFSFEAVETIQVHSNSSSKMFLAKSGQLLSIGTSDGFIKLFDLEANSMILSQKRHNLPVVCAGFLAINDATAPQQVQVADHLICGSPDYTYNIISFSRGGGLLGSLSAALMYLAKVVLNLLVFYGILLFVVDYVDHTKLL